MDQPGGLFGDRPRDIRVAVAKRVDGDPGHAIKIAAAHSIEQIHPLAAIKHKIRTLVGLQYILLLVRDRVVGGHGGSFMTYMNSDRPKYSIECGARMSINPCYTMPIQRV